MNLQEFLCLLFQMPGELDSSSALFNSGKTRLPKKKKGKITNKQNKLNSKRQTDPRRYGRGKIFLRPRGADLETYKQKIE